MKSCGVVGLLTSELPSRQRDNGFQRSAFERSPSRVSRLERSRGLLFLSDFHGVTMSLVLEKIFLGRFVIRWLIEGLFLVVPQGNDGGERFSFLKGFSLGSFQKESFCWPHANCGTIIATIRQNN